MNGELYDLKYPNRRSVYDDRARQSGYALLAALGAISAYYVIYLPVQYVRARSQDNCEDTYELHSAGITSRKGTYDPVSRVYHRIAQGTSAQQRTYSRYPSMLFKSWRDYENIHILMWVGKDVAWNWQWKVMWICFSIPTILIGLDFIHKSMFTQRLLIDHAHYCAQFLWVSSNLIWAYGELFLPEVRDDVIDFWEYSVDARKSARWYATWALLSGKSSLSS